MQLWLVFLLVCLRALLLQLSAQRRQIGRLLLIPTQGIPSTMLRSCACISPSQCDFLRQARYHVDKGRRQRSIVKTRCSVLTSGRNWLCRKLCLIFWLTAPSQVWATPSLWGEAVDILTRAALLLPEPLPGAAPPYLAEAPGNTADLVSDFDRRASLLRQEQLCAISRALENHDDIPVPPIDDNTAALLNSHEVEGVGFVRSPGHQSEVVYFTIRIPLPLYELITGIRDATTALKLRFTHIPLPVFPQLGPDYASVVIAPSGFLVQGCRWLSMISAAWADQSTLPFPGKRSHTGTACAKLGDISIPAGASMPLVCNLCLQTPYFWLCLLGFCSSDPHRTRLCGLVPLMPAWIGPTCGILPLRLLPWAGVLYAKG